MTAGIILCGGRSQRMGTTKPQLAFGPETMLWRIARLLGEVVKPIVVVTANDQTQPELPPSVQLVCDRYPNCGPLEGISVGLQALADRQEAAFVCACDLPLLKPAFVRRTVELSTGYDVAVPYIGSFHEPLAAVYRTELVKPIEHLLAEKRFRPTDLFDQVETRRITAEELFDVDPSLHSLLNVNQPADYRKALRIAGFALPSGDFP